MFAFKLQPKHLTFASKFAQSFYHVDSSILFVKSALKDEMIIMLFIQCRLPEPVHLQEYCLITTMLKSQLTTAFFAAVNHLNGPLRKQNFTLTGSKGQGL